MPDVTFTVLANADDGACNSAGGGFTSNKTGGYLAIGYEFAVGSQHVFFRFDNVTIPSGASIDSAILRVTSYSTGGLNTCNVKVHFETANDPAAPTTDVDLLGRSLDAGIAWSSLPTWTANVTEDSPELKTLLQDIIDSDYGAWNSGQALQVIVVDNSSSTNADRRPATYEHSSYSPAQLVVTYSVPYNAELSESIEISESVSIESDLVREENITLTESVTALLGFDESLPTITQDIELIESVTVLRGLAGLPTQSENIELSESVTMLLGFDESLPGQSESINITEFASVDVGPQIAVFESITLSDYGNIQPEFSVDDSITVAENVEIYRGYWADVDDNFVITDTWSAFNYTDWLRTNRARARERFFFTLTGASDQTTDVEIPISSIYARKRSGDPTYLQVVVPTLNYSGDIAIRTNGEMQVELGYEVDGAIALREEILIADLEDIRIDEGPVNRAVTLSGHKTINYSNNLITIARDLVTYRAVQTRARVFRFSHIDAFLNPGDTVVIGEESMTVNNIVYIIDANRSMMEVREAV